MLNKSFAYNDLELGAYQYYMHDLRHGLNIHVYVCNINKHNPKVV